METEKYLRSLAKSPYWQNIYTASKENNGISLFQNNSNFSGLQIRFWYWLNIYDNLYKELQQLSDDHLTEKVINDDDRCDAFLVYRSQKNEHFYKQLKMQEKAAQHKNRHKNKHQDGNMNLIDIDYRSN